MIFNLVVLVSLLLVFHQAACESEPVTCGSVVKIIHKDTGHHLHSHPIAWGSGSGQQSVTSTGSIDDQGSLWIVKDATTSKIACEIGAPILCGSKLRLEHASTGKNLHSHLYRAALTGNQEVSGFGDGGNGDTGDNWKIVCDNSGEKYWRRTNDIHFEHVDTKKYLFTAGKAKFTPQNCGQGCPIMGQTEVSAAGMKSMSTKFRTGAGLYFPPPAAKNSKKDEDDDEL